jgi:hypothetical protein
MNSSKNPHFGCDHTTQPFVQYYNIYLYFLTIRYSILEAAEWSKGY